MEGFGVPGFNSVGNVVRKKRSTSSRRPRPDSSTPPSDNVGKVSGDEYTGYETSSRRKEFNVNQFAIVTSVNLSEGETARKKIRKNDGAYGDIEGLPSIGGSKGGSEQGRSGLVFKRCKPAMKEHLMMRNSYKVQDI